jgi:hypothetical protein
LKLERLIVLPLELPHCHKLNCNLIASNLLVERVPLDYEARWALFKDDEVPSGVGAVADVSDFTLLLKYVLYGGQGILPVISLVLNLELEWRLEERGFYKSPASFFYLSLSARFSTLNAFEPVRRWGECFLADS